MPPVVTPKLTRVLQDGPVAQYCTSPPPADAGAATATLSAPFGTFVSQWSLPAEITAGSGASLQLSIQPAPGQRLAAGLRIKPPSEFGASPPPT